jgi:hypothetical protein
MGSFPASIKEPKFFRLGFVSFTCQSLGYLETVESFGYSDALEGDFTALDFFNRFERGYRRREAIISRLESAAAACDVEIDFKSQRTLHYSGVAQLSDYRLRACPLFDSDHPIRRAVFDPRVDRFFDPPP